MRAHSLLARGWLRATPAWWWATAAILGCVLGGAIASAGLLQGMQEGAQVRVADFFTGDVRVTPPEGKSSVASAPDANASTALARSLEAAGGPGTRAVPRLETQYILSRRSLLEAYFEEQEEYGVQVPGGSTSGNDFYGAGLLLGLPQAGMGDVATYLVAGRMPRAASDGPVELALSEQAFRTYLAKEEVDGLTAWPPTGPEMEVFTFEVTAGHVDTTGRFKDIVRLRAHVVGLFDSGLDILDRFAAVSTLEDARRLVGADPQWGPANAITVTGGDVDAASAAAQRDGSRTQTPQEYARTYVGQTLLVVEFLGSLLSAVLLVIPLLLVWHGVQQMLDRQRRQLAVCRAIGVPASTLRASLARLAATVTLRALAVALLLLGLLVAFLVAWPPTWAPVPVAVAVPWRGLAFTGGVLAVGLLLALWLASRSVLRDQLAMTLRA